MEHFRRLWRRLAPPSIDQIALRDEMTREDPEFAHTRKVRHDALQALTAKRMAEGLAIRRERQFWQRSGDQ